MEANTKEKTQSVACEGHLYCVLWRMHLVNVDPANRMGRMMLKVRNPQGMITHSAVPLSSMSWTSLLDGELDCSVTCDNISLLCSVLAPAMAAAIATIESVRAPTRTEVGNIASLLKQNQNHKYCVFP